MPDDSQQSLPRISPFDRIKHTTDEGTDYWSARELMPILGYSGWQRFSSVVEKAKIACENSGYAVADHFNASVRKVAIGSGAERDIEDVLLSRYACYLVVQNGDPSKPIIALGQTYFAERTYHDEQMQDALAGLTEAQRRLFLRGEVADANVQLAATAYDAGVLTSRDFAIFQDHGYMGLYGGERSRDIHARKELRPKDKILDHMGSEELAANWFRATQAEAKLRREPPGGKDAANQTHFTVGREVRETIQRLGGTPPEQLPTPAHSIQELRRLEERRIEAKRQPSLFGPEDEASEGKDS